MSHHWRLSGRGLFLMSLLVLGTPASAVTYSIDGLLSMRAVPGHSDVLGLEGTPFDYEVTPGAFATFNPLPAAGATRSQTVYGTSGEQRLFTTHGTVASGTSVPGTSLQSVWTEDRFDPTLADLLAIGGTRFELDVGATTYEILVGITTVWLGPSFFTDPSDSDTDGDPLPSSLPGSATTSLQWLSATGGGHLQVREGGRTVATYVVADPSISVAASASPAVELPEPGSMAALAIGIVGLLGRRRTARRAAMPTT